MTCAPSEDSDQPGHLPSHRCPHEETLGPLLPIESTVKTDQTRDAQADVSVRWAHMSFCWFCLAAAQIVCVRDVLGSSPCQVKCFFHP